MPEKNPSYPDESRISGSSSVKQPNNTNADEAALTALRQKINYHSKGAGVAFIGYVESGSSEIDLRAYYASSKTGKAYPDLGHAPLYMAEGQELYAIIPPNDKGTITVYPSTMTEDGEYMERVVHRVHQARQYLRQPALDGRSDEKSEPYHGNDTDKGEDDRRPPVVTLIHGRSSPFSQPP